MSTIQDMTNAREAVRKALNDFEGALEAVINDETQKQIERKSAEVSLIQVESARRVLWMD